MVLDFSGLLDVNSCWGLAFARNSGKRISLMCYRKKALESENGNSCLMCIKSEIIHTVLTERIQQGGRTTQLPGKAKTLAINFDFLSDSHTVNHRVLFFEVYLLANFLSSWHIFMCFHVIIQYVYIMYNIRVIDIPISSLFLGICYLWDPLFQFFIKRIQWVVKNFDPSIVPLNSEIYSFWLAAFQIPLPSIPAPWIF